MDLPPGMLDFIDQYVSEALETTGTRKAKPAAAAPQPPAPTGLDVDTLIPIHLDMGDYRDPSEKLFAELFGHDEKVAPSLRPDRDVESLPPERAPRSSVSPLVLVHLDDDDEITNVVGKPTK